MSELIQVFTIMKGLDRVGTESSIIVTNFNGLYSCEEWLTSVILFARGNEDKPRVRNQVFDVSRHRI